VSPAQVPRRGQQNFTRLLGAYAKLDAASDRSGPQRRRTGYTSPSHRHPNILIHTPRWTNYRSSLDWVSRMSSTSLKPEADRGPSGGLWYRAGRWRRPPIAMPMPRSATSGGRHSAGEISSSASRFYGMGFAGVSARQTRAGTPVSMRSCSVPASGKPANVRTPRNAFLWTGHRGSPAAWAVRSRRQPRLLMAASSLRSVLLQRRGARPAVVDVPP